MAGFGGGKHRPDPAQWLFWMDLREESVSDEREARLAWGDEEYERMRAEVDG